MTEKPSSHCGPKSTHCITAKFSHIHFPNLSVKLCMYTIRQTDKPDTTQASKTNLRLMHPAGTCISFRQTSLSSRILLKDQGEPKHGEGCKLDKHYIMLIFEGDASIIYCSVSPLKYFLFSKVFEDPFFGENVAKTLNCGDYIQAISVAAYTIQRPPYRKQLK